MVARRALVDVAGEVEELPAGDHLVDLAIPRTSELTVDFTTLATFPVYVALLTTTLTTILASSYLAFDFTCALRHVGPFAGNVAPTARFRLDGVLLQGGCTVNMLRSLIMPMARQGRQVVAAGVHTMIVEVSKFGGGANVLAISPVLLANLDHASLTLREEL
jgi:hypothetical protein